MTTIVYTRKGLSWLYNIFLVVFVALGLLLLLAAFGEAVGKEPWSSKWMGVVAFGLAGLSWLLGAPQMWTLGRRYARNVVRIDVATFSLHSAGGTDIQFALADVTAVRWNPKWKSRLCTVETSSSTFEFDTRACPKVKRVAAVIAERAGKGLQVVSGE